MNLKNLTLTQQAIATIKHYTTSNEIFEQMFKLENEYQINLLIDNKHLKQLVFEKMQQKLLYVPKYQLKYLRLQKDLKVNQDNFSKLYELNQEIINLVNDFYIENHIELYEFIDNQQQNVYNQYQSFLSYLKNYFDMFGFEYEKLFNFKTLVQMNEKEKNNYLNTFKLTSKSDKYVDIQRFKETLENINYFFKEYNILPFNFSNYVDKELVDEKINNYLIIAENE